MKLKLTVAPTVEPVSLEEAKNHLRVDSGDDNALITSLIKTARRFIESQTGKALIDQTWEFRLDYAGETISIPKAPLHEVSKIEVISEAGVTTLVRAYDAETTVDADSALGQKVLGVASTVGFGVTDKIIINRGGAREEEGVVFSIQAGISLTLVDNLTFTHTGAQADAVEGGATINYDSELPHDSPGRVKLKEGCTWPDHRGFDSFIVTFIAGYGAAATDVPDELKQGVLQLIGHYYDGRQGEELPSGVEALIDLHKIHWL